MTPPIAATPPVDVSLTAIAARLDRLPEVLDSLLAQDYAPRRVHLYLSHEPHLLDAGVPALPPALAAMQAHAGGRLEVRFVPNTGPYRKLLPYLRAAGGRSRLVATADDDTLYPPDWLSGLVAGWRACRCVVGYRGHRIRIEAGAPAPYRSWMQARTGPNPGRLLLPIGKEGVLYDTAFFPDAVLDTEAALRIAPTADDLWFRWHLALNRIPVFLIDGAGAGPGAGPEAPASGDSLFLRYNMAGGNDATVAALEAYIRRRHGASIADLDPGARPAPRRTGTVPGGPDPAA